MRPSRSLHVLLALAIAVPAALPAQTPTFAPLEPLPLGGALLYGNFNGNGNTDLIIHLGDTSYFFYTGDGAGNFVYTPAGGPGGTLTLPQVTAHLIADVNGDGKDDIILLDNGCSSTGCVAGSLNVLLSQGNGVFTPGSTTALPAGYSNLEGIVGDFNKDGKPDLAVLADSDGSFAGPAAQLLIFLNNGSGGFTQTAYQLAPSDFTDFSPTNLVTGDFEGNGNQDLAFATDYGSYLANPKIWTFAGNGKGGFGPAVASYTLDSFINPGDLEFTNALTLFAADLNGDGRTDLLISIASKTDFGANSRVPSLLAEVSGKFHWSSAVYITGTDLVALADLNGDGKPDLVFVDSASRGPTVPAGIYLGLGNGAFQTPHIPLSLTNISPDGCGSVTALPLKTGALPSILFPCAGLFVNTTSE